MSNVRGEAVYGPVGREERARRFRRPVGSVRPRVMRSQNINALAVYGPDTAGWDEVEHLGTHDGFADLVARASTVTAARTSGARSRGTAVRAASSASADGEVAGRHGGAARGAEP